MIIYFVFYINFEFNNNIEAGHSKTVKRQAPFSESIRSTISGPWNMKGES